MNSIRFNPNFTENTISESNKSAYALWECSEMLSRSVQALCDCNGFGIDELQEALLNENNRIKQLYEKLTALKTASERAMSIYVTAD